LIAARTADQQPAPGLTAGRGRTDIVIDVGELERAVQAGLRRIASDAPAATCPAQDSAGRDDAASSGLWSHLDSQVRSWSLARVVFGKIAAVAP
jgi:hypothetical protein